MAFLMTFKEFILFLYIFSPVFGEIFINSTCPSEKRKLGYERGSTCTFFCKVQKKKKNEKLIVSRHFLHKALGYNEEGLRSDKIYEDGSFVDILYDTGRYTIDKYDKQSVQFTITGLEKGDSGYYICETELFGNQVDISKWEILKVEALESDMTVKLAKKKSSTDREIEKFYDDKESVSITEAEYELIVLVVEVKDYIVEDWVTCSLYVYTNDHEKGVYVAGMYTRPDLTNYTPENGLFGNSTYTALVEHFQLPDEEYIVRGEFYVEGRCFYPQIDSYRPPSDVKHISGRLHVKLEGNDAAATPLSIALIFSPFMILLKYFMDI